MHRDNKQNKAGTDKYTRE